MIFALGAGKGEACRSRVPQGFDGTDRHKNLVLIESLELVTLPQIVCANYVHHNVVLPLFCARALRT